jgi:hypothetical protein
MTMTAEAMAAHLNHALHGLYGPYEFHVGPAHRLGVEESLHITFASVPRGSSELQALNAKHNLMLSVTAPKGSRWTERGTAPLTVTVEKFRGNAKFTKKTGPVDKVLGYIVQYFVTRHGELTGGGR